MIDINELRRLAQAATSGEWYVERGNHIYGRNEVTDGEEVWHPVIACTDDDEVNVNFEANAAFIAAANPAAVSEILDRLEASEKENAKLREALVEKVVSETMLRDLSIRGGSIHASFEGGAMHLLVDAFVEQFVESGATNYLEMQFHSNVTGPLVVTLQRVNGKTAHQLRAEAEKERDALRVDKATLQQMLYSIKNHLEAAEKSDAESIAMYRKARDERDALRAKVERMERQEPLDADSDVFRSAFEAALKAGNWPATRQGDGYRSPSTQIAWRIAFSTVNRLKLYALPGAQPAPSLASDDVSFISEGKTQPAQSVKDDIIDDLQSQFDTEGITEHDSGDALIRLSDAIAAVEDNFTHPDPIIPEGWKPVPIEVIHLYSIMCAAFVPMTPQHEEIAIQLDRANRAMLAVAPEAKP